MNNSDTETPPKFPPGNLIVGKVQWYGYKNGEINLKL